MISRTVRVFKLMYIVAGILISNEEICNTVDRIQIAPRVEMTSQILAANYVQRQASVDKISGRSRKSWLSRFNVFNYVRSWREFVETSIKSFNIWTIPNYVLVRSSNYISRKFFLNNDCDIIYK